MENPKITICMSTYNGERYLKEQLDSFLHQTYHNWQLLVHDDGSEDSTRAIILEYVKRDDRIHFVQNVEHLGIKRAFLTLLSITDSELYAFSDQDDVWHEDKLGTLVQRLSSEEPAVPTLVYSRYDEIDGQDRPMIHVNGHPNYGTSLNDFLLVNTATGCTFVLNHALRDYLVRPLDEIDYSMLHMHDWWAALVASAFGKVIFVNQALVSYRQHGDNVLGAPVKANFIQRFLRFLAFRESRIVGSGVNQAGELLRLYQSQLSVNQVKLVSGVAQLFSGWAPVCKINFLRRNHLFIHSKFLNIETVLLVLMFPNQRTKILLRNRQ